MVKRLSSFALLTVVVLSLAATACSSGDPDVSSGSTSPSGTGTTVPVGGSMMTTTPAAQLVTAETLTDKTFSSTSVTGYDLAPGSTIVLSFTATDLTASAGCNSQGGAYSLEGGKLVITRDLRSTMMACPEPLMSQDTWLSGWLASDLAIAATPDGIALTGQGVTAELAVEATGSPEATGAGALVGPTWTVHTFVAGDAVSNLASSPPATFRFAEDGKVTVFTGCHEVTTTWEVTNGKLRFGPTGTTPNTCADPAANPTDFAITIVMGDPVTFSIEGGDLQMTAFDGGYIASPG